tara:strand:+ start:1268 stop:1513 length:246 start_codon:yes stop_codon:yes gene_type:complete
MPNGYQIFKNLNPVGGLYRYKGYVNARLDGDWKVGKAYLLTKWERPEGIDKKSPLINAFFLVNGAQRRVDIGFFRYLEQVE